MLYPVKEHSLRNRKCFGFWHRKFGDSSYTVNLWLALPVMALIGLIAGMVGISGGSFKIPLMVLLCGVPMRIAIGNFSTMVALTALMGFWGHSIRGDFNPYWAIPLMITAVLGGLIGGKMSLKTKPDHLERIFAYTTLAAACSMLINAFFSV